MTIMINISTTTDKRHDTSKRDDVEMAKTLAQAWGVFHAAWYLCSKDVPQDVALRVLAGKAPS